MSFKNKKSIFIEEQIPQFIRDQYPLFVSFLKSYYDFLDRSQGELIGVKVINTGKNYKSPLLKLYVKQTNSIATNYGEYILDSRPLELIPVLENGRIVRVSVKNFKNVKYDKNEDPIILINDVSGTDAVLEPIILYDSGNIYNSSQDVSFIRDINQENEIFKSYLFNELIPTLPNNLYDDGTYKVEKEKFVKFIKQIYNSKGIEAVFEFIYRILYNTSVEFYYPKTDILRVSDGVWIKNYYIYLEKNSSNNNLPDFIGYQVVTSSGAIGIISNCLTDIFDSNKWRLTIHERNKDFENGDELYLFDFKSTFNGNLLGTIINIVEDDGFFKDDRGFLSSRKKVQDNYYYQDFSYEIQSEYSIKEFSLVLEELLNPAGFKYFIKILINLLIDNKFLTNNFNINFSKIKFADTEIICGEDSFLNKRSLGMNLIDIYTHFNGNMALNVYPIETFAKVDANVNTEWVKNVYYIDSNYNKSHLLEKNTMYGYTIYLNDGTNEYYRTIIESSNDIVGSGNPVNSVKINSPVYFTSGSSELEIFTIIYPGYLIQNVSGNQITLSPYDPFSLKTGNNVSDPDKRYLIGYSIYILNGDAQGEKRKIVGYNGQTQTITLNSPFTGTVNTSTVYRIIPDFDGQEYFGFKITGVNIINGGSGYTSPVLSISSPMSGSSPTFSITVNNGVITEINLTSSGTGVYYEEPKMIITDPNGTGCIFELIMNRVVNYTLSQNINKNLIQGTKIKFNTKNYFKSAILTVNVNNTNINNINIIDNGKGYWFIPHIFEKVSDGLNGKLIVDKISHGSIDTVRIENFGFDYNYDPIFKIEPVFCNLSPFINTIFYKNQYFGKVLYFCNDEYYLYNLNNNFLNDNQISFEIIHTNDGIYFEKELLNINIEDIDLFTTKYLQIKDTYSTEIEVIR